MHFNPQSCQAFLLGVGWQDLGKNWIFLSGYLLLCLQRCYTLIYPCKLLLIIIKTQHRIVVERLTCLEICMSVSITAGVCLSVIKTF